MWYNSPLVVGEWLQGKNLSGVTKQFQADPDAYERWAGIFAKSPTSSIIMASTDDYTSFYRIETDIEKLIPQQEQMEAFYAMKLGHVTPGVPSQFIYVIEKLWDTYHVANLIGSLLPVGLAFTLSENGFLNNQYTGLDVYRTFLSPDINIMDEGHPIVKCGEWYEAWLPSCEMVTALPPCIGERLKPADLEHIYQSKDRGLCLRDVPLTSIGGLKGVCDSVYDLRGAL